MKKFSIFTLILISWLISKDLIGQEIMKPVKVFNNYGGRANAIVERVLDLDKCIFYAHRNRKEIIFAQRGIDLAEERISEAHSFRFPKVDIVLNYSQIDKKDQMTVLPPNFGSLLLPSTYLGQYYFTRLSLWQNIYSGGRYTSSLKLAESNLARVKNQLNIVKNNVNFEVKESFYGLLAIKEKIKAYEEIIPSMKKHTLPLRELKSKEKLQTNRMITEIKNEYSLLKNSRYPQSRWDFLNTLGLELDIVFLVKGEFKPVTEHYNVNELLAWAFQYRTEPRQIRVEEEMDALSMKLSMSARYPTVTLGMYYDFGSEELSSVFSDEKGKVGNITLNLNLPLFDGWASWSRVSQKRIQLEQDKLQRKDMEDSIRLEVRKAHNDYKFWVQELSKRKKELKNYEEILKSVDSRDPATLIETYKIYLDSKMEYIDCICRNLISYAALEHAVGKSLKSE